MRFRLANFVSYEKGNYSEVVLHVLLSVVRVKRGYLLLLIPQIWQPMPMFTTDPAVELAYVSVSEDTNSFHECPTNAQPIRVGHKIQIKEGSSFPADGSIDYLHKEVGMHFQLTTNSSQVRRYSCLVDWPAPFLIKGGG